MDDSRNVNIDKREDIQIEITITNQCNCHCDYCFECSHEYSSSQEEEDRQIEILKKACEQFDIKKYRILNVVFWGGEPMMNTQFLYRIIETTYKYDFVQYMMYTNGMLYDKFVEFFDKDFFKNIKDRINFQLSYDGEPHHSLKRHVKSDILFKTADLMKKLEINFCFKATLAFDSISLLPEIWDSYNELYENYENVRYSPSLDQTNMKNSKDVFEIWKKVVVEVAKKEFKFIKKHGHPLWSWFSRPGKNVCHVNNAIHIHNDGNYYVCHGCPYLKDRNKFVLGNTKTDMNIFDRLNKDIITNTRNRKCIECCAYECQVCHVGEMSNTEYADNYKENWTKVMVNNDKRCKFFQYAGIIYHLLKFEVIKSYESCL